MIGNHTSITVAIVTTDRMQPLTL